MNHKTLTFLVLCSAAVTSAAECAPKIEHLGQPCRALSPMASCIVTDRADGRERLDWWSEANKTSGSTYFEMEDRYLFFYTIARKDKYKGQYDPILKEVANSYALLDY